MNRRIKTKKGVEEREEEVYWIVRFGRGIALWEKLKALWFWEYEE